MTDEQTALDFGGRCRLVRGPQRETLGERFERFHADNPQIFEAIRKEADEQRRAGARRISVKFIVESLRRDPRLQSDGDKWKINNSYASRFARMLIAVDPRYKALIELRDIG